VISAGFSDKMGSTTAKTFTFDGLEKTPTVSFE
jgi:hypothetical protein